MAIYIRILLLLILILYKSGSAQTNCNNINESFPINMDATECHGLYNVPTAKTYNDCAQTCCIQEGCEVYQFNPSTTKCWMGGVDYCTASTAGWVSRARVEPPTSHIWPLPETYTFSPNANIYIDPSNFNFNLDKTTSDIMNEAIIRYKSLIFNHNPESRSTTMSSITGLSITIDDYSEDTLQYSVDESYSLIIALNNKIATLTSKTIWGSLKGLETFSQLVIFNYTERFYVTWQTNINDKPRFSHRGIMIDSSRHFQTVSSIKNILDSMSYAKFNVLHWHITDTQSFPFESKLFPNLWHGSYTIQERYIQNDVTEVIKYAKYRGIRIVPEFDIPGHAQSWCKGYPSICPSSTCLSPLDPSSNMTWDLLNGLIGDEIINLFPDNFVHLGGDEVNTNCWSSTPSIVEWMNIMNFSTPRQALRYFDERAESIVSNNKYNSNKLTVNWVEVFNMFNTTLNKNNVIIQVWKSKSALKSVVDAGFRGILSDSDLWYLPHLEVTWQQMYMNEPYQNIDNLNAQKLIIGGETCMWGETVDVSDIQNTIWPRAAAVAERLWSVQSVNSTQAALPRISYFRCLLNERGIQAALINNPQAREPPPQPGSCYALYDRRRRRI